MVEKAFNKEALQKQIARLKGLPRGDDRPWGTSSEPGLRDELLRVLWEQASSNEHAARIIDRVIEVSQFCPVPVDIALVAAGIPADPHMTGEYTIPEDWKNTGPICSACNSSGMIQENGVWVRCLCADGRDMPERLLKIANSKPQLGKTKSDSESRRYVDRVLIR